MKKAFLTFFLFLAAVCSYQPSFVLSLSHAPACDKAFKIVVLGSSTAYGKGATPIDSAWVYRFTSYVKWKNAQNIVINLGVPGYTTYEVLRPNNMPPPAGRPAPDDQHNITKALSLLPDAIIINLPTNDIASGYTLQEQKDNYERAIALAQAQHVPVWVTTSQPRTNLNAGEKEELKELRDWIYSRFGSHAVNFWSTVSNTDGSINSFYDSGDGIHVNNTGHKIFYEQVWTKHILDTLCAGSTSGVITPIQPLKANAGTDQTITLPASTATVKGSETGGSNNISYNWTKASGPAGGAIANPDAAQTAISSLTQGTYLYVLTVKDNAGALSKDSVKIIVNPAQTPPPPPPPVSGGSARSIHVNIYGGENAYGNAAWNNWNVGMTEQTNIKSGIFKYKDGSSSSVYAVLSHSQSVGDNRATYSGGMAPAEVLRYTSYSSVPRTLSLSGLSAAKKYTIELYASRYSIGNSTIFSVNGTSDTIAVYDNFTHKAVFSNLTPSAEGQIVVEINKLTNYNHLNGFTLTEQN